MSLRMPSTQVKAAISDILRSVMPKKKIGSVSAGIKRALAARKKAPAFKAPPGFK